MVFPQTEIKALPRLERFDMDFDLPDWFLPEFPPAMFLTSRKDLGDVCRDKLITVIQLLSAVPMAFSIPKQLEGLRLLLTQFPPTTIQR